MLFYLWEPAFPRAGRDVKITSFPLCTILRSLLRLALASRIPTFKFSMEGLLGVVTVNTWTCGHVVTLERKINNLIAVGLERQMEGSGQYRQPIHCQTG